MVSDLDRVAAALAGVMRDVETTTSFRWATRVSTYDEWVIDDPRARVRHDPSSAAAYIEGDNFTESFRVPFATDAEMSVGVASMVQDTVTHELRGAWPTCPHHDHPLAAMVLHEQAVWTCPQDGSMVAGIGALSDAGEC